MKYKRMLAYIKNTGGCPLIEWFDEDHAPIGPTLRESMKQSGLIHEEDGRIYVTVPAE